MSKNNSKALTILKRIVGYGLLFIIFSILLVAGVAGGFYASLVKDEPIRSYAELKAAIYDYEETASLYFADEKYLGQIRSDLYRDEVTLDKVSPYIISALISTEDEDFYEHTGVDYYATIRALLQEFLNSTVQTGGSTLTQQLVKNQILTNEVSFERKAKEILLAKRIDRYFKKDEILEAYLNVSSFGRNASGQHIAGIETAAEGIFGISANEVTIAQAAFLAGLPQSPYGYTPFTSEGTVKEDITPVLKRTEYVLGRMLKTGAITQAEYDEAMNFDFESSFAKPKKTAVEQYPYLTMELESRASKIIAEQLVSEDDLKWKDVVNDKELYNQYMQEADTLLRKNGYKVYSTIDKDIYTEMQKVKNNFTEYGDTSTNTVEVGASLIENSTGRIISFVAGRNFEVEESNHATQTTRPNGSTMKPILVFAPAMESGIIQPGSIIPDIKTTYSASSGTYEPKNYGGTYHGLVTARTSLKQSYNIPAVRIYNELLKTTDPMSYLKKMGITSLVDADYGALSAALGGLTYGVTVEENTNAYATLANGGKFVDAYMIEKITDEDGNIIYEHEVKKKNVFSEQTSYLTLDMMRDVISSGTAARLNNYLSFSADWAGKTGTTQNTQDLWFVASNPDVSMGIWFGHDDNKPLANNGSNSNHLRLWAQLINAAYKVNPELIDSDKSFKQPSGIVTRSYSTLSGLLPSQSNSATGTVASDIFNVKYVPTKTDDSLTSGKYVQIGEKAYEPLATTPSEFIKTGYLLKTNFFTQLNIPTSTSISQLLPNKTFSENLVTFENTLPANYSGAPQSVGKVSKSGKVITWSQSSSSDVVGYYVYHSSILSTSYTKVGVISSGSTLSYNVSNPFGSYYVTAVDIEGNESSPSKAIRYADEIKETTDKKQNDNESTETTTPNSNSNETEEEETDND